MNSVVLGLQFGDEGKGKITDFLAKDADIVVRFQGGNNAGHTLYNEGVKTVLHFLPSGILHEDKICVIGNGTVVNPVALCKEIDELIDKGVKISPDNLIISSSAHVISKKHLELDAEREKEFKIGTTKKGIGPTYESKINRTGCKIGDAEKNHLLFSVEEHEAVLKLTPFIKNTTYLFHEWNKKRKSIVFEGAQGTLLDVDHGIYPFVTSSNTTVGAVSTGAGVPLSYIDKVYGVTKAYTTRVGEGPFPTELFNEEGNKLRELGGEYGATTGRPRRCGWLDLVALRYACIINGVTDLVITKVDILEQMDEVKICTGYKYKGNVIDEFDPCMDLSEVEPVYITLPSWKMNDPIFETFVNTIIATTDTNVEFISNGKETTDIEEW